MVTIDKMTEKEASLLLNQMDKNEEELFLLRKKFAANLKGVIPPSKIILLKKLEEEIELKSLGIFLKCENLFFDKSLLLLNSIKHSLSLMEDELQL